MVRSGRSRLNLWVPSVDVEWYRYPTGRIEIRVVQYLHNTYRMHRNQFHHLHRDYSQTLGHAIPFTVPLPLIRSLGSIQVQL
jgi:hypothetical protein